MIVEYLRERVRPIFIPLALVTAWFAAALRLDWPAFLLDAGFALILLAQFRMWDDLADRTHDAGAHPHRVLVRVPDVTQVVAACGVLAVLNICLAAAHDASGIAVAVLGGLNLVLGAWYLTRTRRTAAGEFLLLAKYPAIVLVVAGERAIAAPVTIVCSALLLYCGVCAYEAWHDPASPLSFPAGGQS
jgi:hypothetical protein